MDQHRRNAKRIGSQAGMLATGAAEAGQRVMGHVITALDADLLDRIRHVLHRNGEKTVGHLFRRAAIADHLGHFLESLADGRCIERLVAVGSENFREEIGRKLAEHHVRIGDGERPAATIGFRTGIGAGRIRACAKTAVLEMQDRAAAGGNRVDRHHRRAHAHTCHFCLEGAFEFAVIMGNVCRRAAHVEADHPVEPGKP
ncbi:hypothetical protein D3C71_913970 [compost metagenome]